MAFNDEFPKELTEGVKKVAGFLTHNKFDKDDLVQEGLTYILELPDKQEMAYYLHGAKLAMLDWLRKNSSKGMTYTPGVRRDDGTVDKHKKQKIHWVSLDQMIEEERFINDRD